METKIFNLIILDESGSMVRIEKQAVDGVNETLQSIRAAQKEHPEQHHFVTLVAFNEETNIIYDCQAAENARDITDKDYCPNRCTALYDAMGTSLQTLKKQAGSDDKVLVTIVTDGEENASAEFDSAAIKKLVDELKARGWVFVYMGADHNVEQVAQRISITNTMSFSATPQSTVYTLARERSSRSRMYQRIATGSFDAAEENKSFFEEDKK